MKPAGADPPDPLHVLAARLRGLRAERGLSQSEFAGRAGVHRTYVSAVERGRRNLALVNVLRLASALDVDPGDLLEGLDADGLPPHLDRRRRGRARARPQRT